MVRPVTLSEAPAFHPFVCIRCKIGTTSRRYFIDLGIDISGEFNPMYDGNIYYCDECSQNLIVDMLRVIQEWDIAHAPWQGDDKSELTYNWESALDERGIESPSGSSEGTDTDDLIIEPAALDDAATDEIPDGTVPTVPSDGRSSLSITRDGFGSFD